MLESADGKSHETLNLDVCFDCDCDCNTHFVNVERRNKAEFFRIFTRNLANYKYF